jgi:hypothetical protein
MAAMSARRDVAAHAGGLYRKTFAWLRPSVRRADAEVEHLREIERAGESGETPFIAMLGVALFLTPIFLVIVGLSFAAYYIAR